MTFHDIYSTAKQRIFLHQTLNNKRTNIYLNRKVPEYLYSIQETLYNQKPND